MDAGRRAVVAGLAAVAWVGPAFAAAQLPAEVVIQTWYRLILELVRHTPTCSPPVASRALAYIGVAAFEALVPYDRRLRTLAGQLNGLAPLAPPPAGAQDSGVVLQATLAAAVRHFFGNTGPTGQRAMAAMSARLGTDAAAGLPQDVVARSVLRGEFVAAHVIAWSATDGGAVIDNMGFAREPANADGPAAWIPTSLIIQQQGALLPLWGGNRPFAMPPGAGCVLPPPPVYSEDEGSAFYAQAREVHDLRAALTPDQRAIARFWSDDAMLSPTPPGHWVSIAMQVMDRAAVPANGQAEVLARLGVALADAFIACWRTKFEVNLLRPVTYIRRVIDPTWDPLIATPPFPEYPSGHSTQSAAAATVLGAVFGAAHAFEDATHVADGLPARRFAGFAAAADEAAMSRLYGGIHFRAAVEHGLEQGRCVGGYVNALVTRV